MRWAGVSSRPTPSNNPGHQGLGELPWLECSVCVLSHMVSGSRKRSLFNSAGRGRLEAWPGLWDPAPRAVPFADFNVYPFSVMNRITVGIVAFLSSVSSLNLRVVMGTPEPIPFTLLRHRGVCPRSRGAHHYSNHYPQRLTFAPDSCYILVSSDKDYFKSWRMCEDEKLLSGSCSLNSPP